MEVSMIAAAINPQRLADGSSLVVHVVREATPYLLYPYPAFKQKGGAFRRLLEDLRKDDGLKVAIDSGGFELASGTAHGIDPVDVVNLQNSSADIGWILDYPPDKLPFDECLQMTANHVKAAADIEKKFEYYLVIHGRNITQLDEWYGALRGLDTFQGISVSGIEFSELLRGFIFAVATPGWKNWHFLGTSSITQISLIHYLSRRLVEVGRTEVERITFDSSTPTQFGKAARIFHPFVPVEVLDLKDREFDSAFLRSVGSDFDGSATSVILSNVKSLTSFSKVLERISSSKCVSAFVESLFPVRMKWKWELGKRIIDTAIGHGSVEALKLIPPELDRVKGLRKKRSVLTL